MHVFEHLNKKFSQKTMQTDLKFVTVKGNHDCDIETCMQYINTDYIAMPINVKELEKCGCHLAEELY